MLPVKIFFIFIFFGGSSLSAKELFQTGESIRSLGMGGVRIGSEHETTSFYTNPAHLRFMKGFNWRLLGAGAGINGLEIYNEVKGVDFQGLSSISQFYGQHVWVGAEAETAIALPYFGFGAFDQAHVEAMLHNPAMPELDMTYLNDLTFAAGFALPLGPEVGLGVNIKRVNRFGGPQIIGADVLKNATKTDVLNQFQDQGIGYGLDLGFIYEVNIPFRPTVSVGWQDVGYTSFTKIQGSEAPDRIEDNLTAGFSVGDSVPGISYGLGIEYWHMTQANEQFGKKIHAGAELGLPLVTLRGGYYQGYPTYGAGVDLMLVHVDASVYTVERGAYPGQTPEQRFQIGMNMDFTLDPDFSLRSANGESRIVKQRR